ncbi:MAG: EF-hand domain-containing protein [Alphaproteobacteria bacterium]|nr:EF-hand domain-containing protein [Alphaproteobacteria bacterium]
MAEHPFEQGMKIVKQGDGIALSREAGMPNITLAIGDMLETKSGNITLQGYKRGKLTVGMNQKTYAGIALNAGGELESTPLQLANNPSFFSDAGLRIEVMDGARPLPSMAPGRMEPAVRLIMTQLGDAIQSGNAKVLTDLGFTVEEAEGHIANKTRVLVPHDPGEQEIQPSKAPAPPPNPPNISSGEEWLEQQRVEKAGLDKNHNGVVSGEEAREFAIRVNNALHNAQHGKDASKKKALAFLATLDFDGDGEFDESDRKKLKKYVGGEYDRLHLDRIKGLAPEKLPQASPELKKKTEDHLRNPSSVLVDQMNTDNYFSLPGTDERIKEHYLMQAADALRYGMDANQNGTITSNEIDGMTAETRGRVFVALDTNKDGKVVFGEIDAAVAKLRSMGVAIDINADRLAHVLNDPNLPKLPPRPDRGR